MKKAVVVLAIVALVFTFALVNQASAQMVMSAKGVKVGLNIANLSGDDVNDADARTLFSAGAFARFGLGPIFAIQPELLMSMKGAKWESGSIETTLDLTYIEIPVLFRVNIPLQTFVPAIYAGPYLGIKASDELKVDDQTMDNHDMKLKSTDFGLAFGVEGSFALLSVEARYTMGMSSIDEDADVKNKVISFLVGYSF